MSTKLEDAGLVTLLSNHAADVLPVLSLPYLRELFPARLQAIEWVSHFVELVGDLPSLKELKTKFPLVDTLQRPEPLPYIVSELKKEYVERITSAHAEAMKKEFGAKDFQKFREVAERLVDRLRQAEAPIGSTVFDSDLWNPLQVARVDKDAAQSLRVIPTGLVPFDNEIGGGLRAGKLYTVAALVSLGKTYFSISVAENARKAGYRVLYVTLEMSQDDIAERALCVRYGLNVNWYVRMEQPETSSKAGETKEVWYKRILAERQKLIEEDTCTGKVFIKGSLGGFITPRAIAAAIKECGAQAVYIDAAQDIKPSNPSKDRTAGLYEALEELNGIATHMGVPILMTVQLTSEVEKKGLNKNLLAYVQWGQVFAQKSYVMVTMLGDRSTGDRDMRFEKGRDGGAGVPFKVTFKFPFFRMDSSMLSATPIEVSPEDVFDNVTAVPMVGPKKASVPQAPVPEAPTVEDDAAPDALPKRRLPTRVPSTGGKSVEYEDRQAARRQQIRARRKGPWKKT